MAVAIGPPLETSSTVPSAWCARTWSSACTTPATKSACAGMPCGLRRAGHPCAQALAQQAEVLAHLLGRVGPAAARGGRRAPRPRCRTRSGRAAPARRGAPAGRLRWRPAICAWRRSVPVSTASKRRPRCAEPRAQAHALALAEGAQLVVVGGAERGLAVAHEVQGSHGGRIVRASRRCAVARATGPRLWAQSRPLPCPGALRCPQPGSSSPRAAARPP